MSKTSTFEGWQESQSRNSEKRVSQKQRVRYNSAAARKVTELLTFAGIGVNGPEPWDIQVHDERFFGRALGEGSIGVGESYMDGWWDVPALDEFFTRFRRADLASKVHDLKTALLVLKTRVLNLQTMQRAKQVAHAHYDLGNELYQAMLDRRMQYTCAYWKEAATLDQAQENKLHLICRKLQLAAGDDAARTGRRIRRAGPFHGYRVRLPRGQLQHFPRTGGLRPGTVQRIAGAVRTERLSRGRRGTRPFRSRGLHRSLRAHRIQELSPVHAIGADRLEDRGLFLLHTIGNNESYSYTDPWIHKYIFPNGLIPSMAQLGTAWEGLWVVEDWHNFGPDYDQTLHGVVAEFRPRLAGTASYVWRSVLSHVEVLSDGMRRRDLPFPQASALADRPLEGRHFFLHAHSVGLRSYGPRGGPSEAKTAALVEAVDQARARGERIGLRKSTSNLFRRRSQTGKYFDRCARFQHSAGDRPASG